MDPNKHDIYLEIFGHENSDKNGIRTQYKDKKWYLS